MLKVVFFTSKNADRQIFRIHLSKRDKKLLFFIKDFLGIGQISNSIPRMEFKSHLRWDSEDEKSIQYIISRKESLLEKILPIFDTFSLLTRKLFQYQAWREILINRINKKKSTRRIEYTLTENNTKTVEEILKLDYYDNWLSGFIEGEGSFILSTNKGKFAPYFMINQKYDFLVINSIKEKFKIKANVLERKGNLYEIHAASKAAINNIVEFLDSPSVSQMNNTSAIEGDNFETPSFAGGLKGYKLEQFLKWKEKVLIWLK